MKNAGIWICSFLSAFFLYGQQPNADNLVFNEGFEDLKVTSSGNLHSSLWYPPQKVKEKEEFRFIRSKQEVCSGKFSLKLSNAKDKGTFFIINDKSLPGCGPDECFLISADARGTGFLQIGLINYTADNKFLGTISGGPVAGKPSITKQKPLSNPEWSTFYFTCQMHSKAQTGATCKLALFANEKSEIYLDNIKIFRMKKKDCPRQ